MGSLLADIADLGLVLVVFGCVAGAVGGALIVLANGARPKA